MKIGFEGDPVNDVVNEVPGGEEGDSKAKAKTSSKFSHERDDRVNLEMVIMMNIAIMIPILHYYDDDFHHICLCICHHCMREDMVISISYEGSSCWTLA